MIRHTGSLILLAWKVNTAQVRNQELYQNLPSLFCFSSTKWTEQRAMGRKFSSKFKATPTKLIREGGGIGWGDGDPSLVSVQYYRSIYTDLSGSSNACPHCLSMLKHSSGQVHGKCVCGCFAWLLMHICFFNVFIYERLTVNVWVILFIRTVTPG